MTTLGNQSQPGGNFLHWPPNGVYERGNLSFRTKAFYSCGKVKNTSWFRSFHSYNVKYGAVKASKSFPPPTPPIKDGKMTRFAFCGASSLIQRVWGFAVPFYSV